MLIDLEDAPVALRYRHNDLPEGAAPDGLLLAFAELVRDVRTAHDLRGLAVLGLHAIGAQPATFSSTTSDDARAYGYLAE